MADFCKQCSLEHFGEDHKELAGISTAEQTRNGIFPVVICEGCGTVQVDHTGTCVSEDCNENHGSKKRSKTK